MSRAPRSSTIRLTIAAVVLLLAPMALESQVPDPPAGARVRLTIADSMRVQPLQPRITLLVGHVDRVVSDTFYVTPAGAVAPAAIPRDVIRQVAVSRGDSRARSMVAQAVAFAVSGVIVGRLATERGGSWQRAGEYALVGAAMGATFGVLSPYEHWKRLR